jgi:fumarate reductase subunit C
MEAEIGIIPIIVVWIMLASYIGAFAYKRGVNFWLGFSVSFLFTPIVGAIAVVATMPKVRKH